MSKYNKEPQSALSPNESIHHSLSSGKIIYYPLDRTVIGGTESVNSPATEKENSSNAEVTSLSSYKRKRRLKRILEVIPNIYYS